MGREHVKGAADKAKGAIKDAAGRGTGDRNCERKASWTKRRALLTTQQAM